MDAPKGFIGRPPYYRPPRTRPISFESPVPLVQGSKGSLSISVVRWPRSERPFESTGRRGQQTARIGQLASSVAKTVEPMQVIHSQRRLADLPSHNNVPQPFRRPFLADSRRLNREHDEDSLPSPMTPKILVNDAPLASYPTSTVHKSLLSSRRLHWDAQEPSSAKENSAGSTYSSRSAATAHDREGCAESSWSGSSSPSWWLGSTRCAKVSPEEKPTWSVEHHDTVRQQQAQSVVLPVGLGARACSPPGRPASGGTLPDSKRDQFLWHRQLERASIAHQSYRTLPIVMPKPKALHDLNVDNYMRFGQDPTFEVAQWRAQAGRLQRDHERKIQAALSQAPSHLSSTGDARVSRQP